MIEYYVENLNKCFNNVGQINYYKNGKKKEIKINKLQKLIIKNYFSTILEDAHVLPSLGVSLHNETKKEMQSGEWIEILFSTEQTLDGVRFEGIVFKLEETNSLNLIRVVDGKYDGRNIYIMLDDAVNLSEIFKKFKF